jgi:hypothetical protein
MKQTAVEWLLEQLDVETVLTRRQLSDVINKAKEMELQQRQEDTNYGYSQGWDDGNQNKEPMRPELKQQDQ